MLRAITDEITYNKGGFYNLDRWTLRIMEIESRIQELDWIASLHKSFSQQKKASGWNYPRKKWKAKHEMYSMYISQRDPR